MVDTSSVESFINTLPKSSEVIKENLFLEMHNSKTIKKSTISLIKRGYIGCLAITKDEDAKALRLLPAKKIEECPVVITLKRMTEGMTISPDLKHFVSSIFIYRRANEDNNLSFIVEDEIKKLSYEFGRNESIERVLKFLPESQKIDIHDREGFFWEQVEPEISFFKILEKNHKSFSRDEIYKWILDNIKKMSDSDIIWRLYASLYEYDSSNIDLKESLIRLGTMNNVFDSTYACFSIGPCFGGWFQEPLVTTIDFLLELEEFHKVPLPSDLLEALEDYAYNPNKCNGELFLSYAKRIAKDDPIQAYIQTCNAAAYYARSKKKPPVEAINFAYELARENKWQHLETILKWTVEGIDE